MPSRIAIAVVAALCPVGGALAHDWYPRQCCQSVDCAPLQDDTVIFTAEGWHVLETREIIPLEDARIRFSPDRHFHRCRLEFWDSHSGTRCLFIPAPEE